MGAGCAKTDAGGDYTIDLDPGEYLVQFRAGDLSYEWQWFDDVTGYADRTAVEVGSEPIMGINAELEPFGGIEGTVKAETSGQVVEGARVCAWRFSGGSGHCTYTDAGGHYVIADLPPDKYKVDFWAIGQNYLWQYFDHKPQGVEADPVSVGLSQVVTGLDADLPPGAEVKGMVRHAESGAPFRELFVNFWSLAEDTFWPTRGQTDGSFSIAGLPPGDYKVEFLPYDSDWRPQFWDHKASLEEAATLSLVGGTLTTGIEADIEPTVKPQSVAAPQLLAPSVISSAFIQAQPLPPKLRVCPKGYRKQRVAGKVRCVRKHKHHHRRHR
jgi:hypothetical protein